MDTTPFVAEIRIFACDYPPHGWARCDGQLLQIAQYAGLYSIIGTKYGGNGTTTFALPDLQMAVPVGAGQGAGLSPRKVGESGGEDYVELYEEQMPPHRHAMRAMDSFGSTNDPAGNLLARPFGGGLLYGPVTAEPVVEAGTVIGSDGGSVWHQNMMPTLALTYCIALEGTFPPKP